MSSAASGGMPARLWPVCRCGGRGGTLLPRGCACGGFVHVHTCLIFDEKQFCVCSVCGIPFSRELTEAVIQSHRNACTTPEEHSACDRAAVRILAPCLLPDEELGLLKPMCERLLSEENRGIKLAGILLRIATVELTLKRWKLAVMTCTAIRQLFAGRRRSMFRMILEKAKHVEFAAITCDDHRQL